MRKIKVEIPIVLLTLIMLALMALSGNLVYKSLSEIVNSMLVESAPNNHLMLIKELNSELNDMENRVRLYSLSQRNTYLNDYDRINTSLDRKLKTIQKAALHEPEHTYLLDSLLTLSQQKMVIWNNILKLHLSKKNEQESFNNYLETLDTLMVVQDTIYFEESEKVGFFKRLFGKKREAPQPVVVDRTTEKQTLRQEMEQLEKEIRDRSREISDMESAYLRKNLQVSENLREVINLLEVNEQEQLSEKSQEAEVLANQTYRWLAMFAVSLVLVLLLVLFLFFRDLRKSRIYQSALREAKKQAENLTRTKALFVATVSHEMRTPLNAIQGLSEQLLQKKHEQQTKKDLQVIYESTRHLTELVNDTFDYTRIENKGLELKPSHFLLNDLIDKLEFYHKKGAAHKNIAFKLKKHFDHNMVLLGDESRLKQIINNLLSNAIKFTDAGWVELKVIAKKAEKIQLIKFEISDTGIGIAKESQQLIFDDFIQLETDLDKKAGGTGLGLYIVKKLVELLKGEIEVESSPGSGTVFRVQLPFQEGDAAQLGNTVKSYPAPSALSGQKSLLVDDDEFNRHLLKSLFGKWKLDFDEAQNGKEALDLATENTYALILMDIRMPELNGIDAARLLKTSGNKAKIIALSANTADKINPKQEELFDACAEKPFSEAVLYQLIETVFKNEKHPLEKPTSRTQKLAPDLSELERMSKGNPEFVQEMISLFIESSEKSLNAMQENLEKENYNLVADFAHKLAAPVKYMNVLSVYQKIKAIQDMAENQPNVTELGRKISELKTEIAALHEELKSVLEKISE